MLIAIEGIDNLGKTTIVNRLVSDFQDDGVEAHVFPEFNVNTLSDRIRDIVCDEWMKVDYRSQALLILADKWATSRELDHAIRSLHSVVVADRHIETVYVYQYVASCLQGSSEGDLRHFVEWIDSVCPNHFQRPRYTFLLDGEVDLSISRGGGDVVDKEFLSMAREVFLSRAAESPFYRIIDASRPLHHVCAEIKHLVRGMLDSSC